MRRQVVRRATTSGLMLLLGLLFAGCGGRGEPAYDFPFQDPDLPLDQRLDDLTWRLTVPEKVGQMMNDAPAVPRLGIPAYNWWSEALHGVARAGIATVFPQAIGLAATWDEELIEDTARIISDEARAKHHEAVRRGGAGIYEGLTFWSPNINIFRDPRWGRGMETYGEDPYLTGRLAVRFVKGMQGEDPRYLKTVATAKHFAVHSGPEPDRHTFDARVHERDLRETYLPAFEAAVVEGGAVSVMCAYNRLYGAPCCGSELLLQDILRGEWGFEGYVVSDCGAVWDIRRMQHLVDRPAESAAMALAAGTDLNCGSEYRGLLRAVEEGLVTEEDLDRSLRRLFSARFRLGMFDPPGRVPYTDIPPKVVDSPGHRRAALQTTRASLVLLKNEGDLLPLDPSTGSIAVIGPNADALDVLLGNYNGYPSEPVTLLDGIRRQAGPGIRVVYEQGCEVARDTPLLRTIPPGALSHRTASGERPGLEAALFASREMSGPPRVRRVDPSVDFQWWREAPAGDVPADSFATRWEGQLTPPTSGEYALGLRYLGACRLFLDGDELFAAAHRHNFASRWERVSLEGGRTYPLRIEFQDTREHAAVQLVWSVPDPARRERALQAAASADRVVLVMGLSPRLEGEQLSIDVPGFEGGDRVELGLPAPQRRLIRQIAALGRPTVLVLLNGSPLALPEESELLPAILEAWYPGQAGGTAVAEALFGACNPAGRLPVTFYASVDQLPPFSEYAMEDRTYRYFEGEPLYRFGHGLSYTRFAYSELELPGQAIPGRDVEVSAVVTNDGEREGEEVVQIYLSDREASVRVPVRSLVGFRRIRLRAGESRRVRFTIPEGAFSLLDAQMVRRVEPGTFEVSVGGRQPGTPGAGGATSGVVSGRIHHPGGP